MAPHDVQAPGKASRVTWSGRGDRRAWPAPRPGRGRGGEPPPDPGRGSGWTRRALFLAGSDGSGDLSVFMCLARGPRVAMPPLPAASPSRVLSHPQRSERKSPSLEKGWAGSRSWSLAAQSSQRPTGRPGTPGQALQQGGSGARMVVRTPPPCLDPAPGPPPYNRQSLRHPTPSTWGLRRCPRVGSLRCTAGKSSGLCPGPGPHTHVPKCHSSRPQSMSC